MSAVSTSATDPAQTTHTMTEKELQTAHDTLQHGIDRWHRIAIAGGIFGLAMLITGIVLGCLYCPNGSPVVSIAGIVLGCLYCPNGSPCILGEIFGPVSFVWLGAAYCDHKISPLQDGQKSHKEALNRLNSESETFQARLKTIRIGHALTTRCYPQTEISAARQQQEQAKVEIPTTIAAYKAAIEQLNLQIRTIAGTLEKSKTLDLSKVENMQQWPVQYHCPQITALDISTHPQLKINQTFWECFPKLKQLTHSLAESVTIPKDRTCTVTVRNKMYTSRE